MARAPSSATGTAPGWPALACSPRAAPTRRPSARSGRHRSSAARNEERRRVTAPALKVDDATRIAGDDLSADVHRQLVARLPVVQTIDPPHRGKRRGTASRYAAASPSVRSGRSARTAATTALTSGTRTPTVRAPGRVTRSACRIRNRPWPRAAHGPSAGVGDPGEPSGRRRPAPLAGSTSPPAASGTRA